MSETSGNDKLYVLIILIMIGCFIYWYQTRLDNPANFCVKCDKRHKNRKKSKQPNVESNKTKTKIKHHKPRNKKVVRFNKKNNETNTDISLESLDSSDNASILSSMRIRKKNSRSNAINKYESDNTDTTATDPDPEKKDDTDNESDGSLDI